MTDVEGAAAARMAQDERLLVALDIDGTLIFEDGSFSPGVVDAVRDAADRGHAVTLATGRAWESTRDVMAALGITPEFVVCSNGAATLARADDEAVGYVRHSTETFDASTVLRRLRTRLPDAAYMVELPDGQRLYTRSLSDWSLSNAREVAFDELSGIQVSRVVVVSPDHREDEFLELVDGIGLNQVSYAVGWTAWLDIAPHGVHKGTALAQVRELLGIAAQNVVTIGDGRNDIGMFQWADRLGGRAIAMGQAPREVIQVANEVTLSVDEGGVAAALARLVSPLPR